MIVRDDLSAARTLTSSMVRDAASASRAVTAIKMRDGDNVLRTLASFGFEATLSPAAAYGYGYSKPDIQITTSAVTISVTSGAAPYTVTWNFDDGGWSAVTANSLTTALRSPPVEKGTSQYTNVYATVEDANGQTADTNTISLNCTNYYPY